MFHDEAGLGRINKPKYCWCPKRDRPSVPCYHIREYRYVYVAVEPLTGESCFLVMPYCNTSCMNIFLEELSKKYPNDIILLCCDGAAWHKSNALHVLIIYAFSSFLHIHRKWYFREISIIWLKLFFILHSSTSSICVKKIRTHSSGNLRNKWISSKQKHEVEELIWKYHGWVKIVTVTIEIGWR